MSSTPRDMFEEFVAASRGRRVVVACPADAAGMAAGEMARRHLAGQGCPAPVVITPEEGELLTGRPLRERAREARAEALLALDLGAAAEAVLDDGPTLFVDLHRHQANVPAGVIEPPTRAEAKPAGVVLHELISASGDADPLLWLTTIAAESGHPKVEPPAAPSTPGPAVIVRPKHISKAALRETAVLLNSAGRSSVYQTAAALRLLARSREPRDFLADESAELSALREARAEVMRAVGQWSRTRPRFMWRVALVPVASPCRIEPILAAMWERQLDRYMVVVANSGAAAGRVTVVARTGSRGRDLLRLLDAVTPDDLDGPIALGRRDYVEAVVPRKAWESMLRKMRFRQVEKLMPPPQEATLF